MARIGTLELWQICFGLALGSLFGTSAAVALAWPSWLAGALGGMTVAWAGVALAGFLATNLGDSEPIPEKQAATSSSRRLDLDLLVESIGDPVIAISSVGLVTLANTQASTLLELNGSLVGRHVEEVITKAELLDRILRGRRGERWQGPLRIPGHDGVKVCRVSVVPYTDDRPAPIVLTLRDITELDGALQLKTDFVANASHELRTPIAAIKGAAETLSIASGDKAMRTKLVGMIDSHVDRLESMVSDLLDLSKLESESLAIRVEKVCLPDLASDLTELLYEFCTKRNVELTFDIAPQVETIATDSRLLKLILKNLIENAVKFSNEAAGVRVEAVCDAKGSGCVLRVIDRGLGIPLAQQQRIFERFYQVDPARSGNVRGTGLGLAIVKHAARLLEGEVDVESVWQQGTTMIVSLPDVVKQ